MPRGFQGPLHEHTCDTETGGPCSCERLHHPVLSFDHQIPPQQGPDGAKWFYCKYCKSDSDKTPCSKRFKSRYGLRRHEASHHDHERHKCSICGKGFPQKAHLANHIRKEHEGKKVYCPLCSKEYSDPSPWYRHMYVQHPKEAPDIIKPRNGSAMESAFESVRQITKPSQPVLQKLAAAQLVGSNVNDCGYDLEIQQGGNFGSTVLSNVKQPLEVLMQTSTEGSLQGGSSDCIDAGGTGCETFFDHINQRNQDDWMPGLIDRSPQDEPNSCKDWDDQDWEIFWHQVGQSNPGGWMTESADGPPQGRSLFLPNETIDPSLLF